MFLSGAAGHFATWQAVDVAAWPSPVRESSSLSMSRTGASIDALLDEWLSSETDCSSESDCNRSFDKGMYLPPTVTAPVVLAPTVLQEGEGSYEPVESSSNDPTARGAERGLSLNCSAAGPTTTVPYIPGDDVGYLRPYDSGSSSTPRAQPVLCSKTAALHSAATHTPSGGGTSTHTAGGTAATLYDVYDRSAVANDDPMEDIHPLSAEAVNNASKFMVFAEPDVAARCTGGHGVTAAHAGDTMRPSNAVGTTSFLRQGLATSWENTHHGLATSDAAAQDHDHLALLAAAGQMSWFWSCPGAIPPSAAMRDPQQRQVDARRLQAPFDPISQQQQQQQQRQLSCDSRDGVHSDQAGEDAALRRLLAARRPEGGWELRLPATVTAAVVASGVGSMSKRRSCPPGSSDMRLFKEMMSRMSQAAWQSAPDGSPTGVLPTARNGNFINAGYTALGLAAGGRGSECGRPSGGPQMPTAAVAALPAGYSLAATPQVASTFAFQGEADLMQTATAGAPLLDWPCVVGEPWADEVLPQPACRELKPPRGGDVTAYGTHPWIALPGNTGPPPQSEHGGPLWQTGQQASLSYNLRCGLQQQLRRTLQQQQPHLAGPGAGPYGTRDLQVRRESGASGGEVCVMPPGAGLGEGHAAVDAAGAWSPGRWRGSGVPANKRACLVGPDGHLPVPGGGMWTFAGGCAES